MGEDTDGQENCTTDDLPDLTVPHQETVISKDNSLDTKLVTDITARKHHREASRCYC